jgi:hypothetical protein
MIVLLLVALSAVFNSIMDSVENENFFESAFKKFNQKFWYKRVSWQFAKKLFDYKFDAWHISKSLMEMCRSLAIALAYYGKKLFETGNVCLDVLSLVVIFGFLWNFTFWLFYHKIFKVK